MRSWPGVRLSGLVITEVGYECTGHGVQVMGGHGYMREHGMEQLVRDCRIATIYEGTTQVQALDLVGRKTLMAQGKPLGRFVKQVQEFIAAHGNNEKLKPYLVALEGKLAEWQQLTQQVMAKSFGNFDEAGAASVDYLMYAGYVVLAYGWARMVAASLAKLAAADGGDTGVDRAFHEAKLLSAQFYYARILPRTLAHREGVLAGAQSLMAMPAEAF